MESDHNYKTIAFTHCTARPAVISSAVFNHICGAERPRDVTSLSPRAARVLATRTAIGRRAESTTMRSGERVLVDRDEPESWKRARPLIGAERVAAASGVPRDPQQSRRS